MLKPSSGSLEDQYEDAGPDGKTQENAAEERPVQSDSIHHRFPPAVLDERNAQGVS
jgi:hypothetical protein